MGHLIDSSDLQSQLLFVANLKYNFIAAHIALKNREWLNIWFYMHVMHSTLV